MGTPRFWMSWIKESIESVPMDWFGLGAAGVQARAKWRMFEQ